MKKRFERLIILLVILVMVFSNVKPLYAQIVAEGDLILENDYIRLNYRYQQGKFKTISMQNKWTQETNNTVVMHEDSKEFELKILTVPEPKNWQVRVSSEATNEGAENIKTAIIDGNPATYWHTRYQRGNGPVLAAFPHWAEITFDTAKTIKRFMYQPRSIVNGNGNARNYKFYVKHQNQTDFQLAKQGELTYDTSDPIWVELDQTYNQVEAVKFEIHSTRNGNNFGLIAEFDVSSLSQAEADATQSTTNSNTISGKDLLVQSINQEEDMHTNVLKVAYQPITKQNTSIQVTRVFTLGKTDKFVRSHLEITVPQHQQNNIAFDTMDIQSYQLQNGEGDVLWKLPQQANIAEMAGFNGFYAGLGQPVYLHGAFYTGSEFPLAHNTVEQGVLFSRYYSGKKLSQQPLVENTYKTWPVAFGVSRNNKYEVVQQDFYDYIRQIGTITSFRKQYNSWFDFMKNFNARNIQHSFKEVDEGFTSYGVSPLDSYVVDDGWQDNNTVWDFNRTTFPNQLYDSSKDVKRLGSDFGLWLGPQGGYGESTGQIARAAIRDNLGSMNRGVVNVGDKRYVDHLKSLLVSYQDKFDINYWKLDGMLRLPLANSTDYYIGGGYLNMYSMTETHERWIELYQTLRNDRAGKDLWINLTSFINPSPWFLQWVNSIWMQNAGDVDYQDGVKKDAYRDIDFGSDAAEAITYRDDRYEEVVKLRQWQLPFSNIYNHDPVYGRTANSGKRLSPGGRPRPEIYFSTDEFRDYLYMLGTRGTGFWEFYYSPSMMDDAKWQVNAEAVNWIESNFEILRNAKIHGGKPGHGEVYGYSAWTQDEGIVSIRNPKDTKQSYTLTLDNTIGMYENTNGLYKKVVHGALKHSNSAVWNYGSTIEIELEPYETVIFQFSQRQDTQAPVVIGSRVPANNKVEIEFDERINPETAVFKQGETVLNADLNPDLRTFTVTLNQELQNKEKVTIHAEGIKDVSGNTATVDETVTFYAGGLLLDIPTVKPGARIPDTGIVRKEEFTVSLSANLTTHNQVLAEQEGQWKLFVDEQGKVNFQMKGTTVTSAPFTTKKADDTGALDTPIPLNEKVDIKAIRYENGSLRLYINGLVSNSAYDKDTASLELNKADVIVGTENFQGTISNFKLILDAMRYDDIAKEANVENEPYVQLPVADTQATSFDPDDNGAHPANLATDGSIDTYWASSRDFNNNTDRQYLTIELEEIENVKAVNYTPRQVPNAVGTITKAKIQVSENGQDWVGFPSGTGEVDWPGAEDYSTKIVVAETPVRARYIRLYGLETHHWHQDRGNTIVSAAEFSVYAEKVEQQVLTFAYLEGELDNFLSKNPAHYDETSYNNAKVIADRASAVLADKANYQGSQDDVDSLYNTLKEAIAALTVSKVDLEATITRAEDAKTTDQYLEASDEVKTQFDQALAAAIEVRDANNSVQSQINEKKDALNTAIAGLDGIANLKKQAKAAVVAKQEEKVASIESNNTLTNEEKESWKQDVVTKSLEGQLAIDQAENKDAIETAKTQAIEAVQAVSKQATSKPNALAAINQAATVKSATIDENNALTSEEKEAAKQLLIELANQAKEAVEQAENDEQVLAEKTKAVEQINQFEVVAEAKPTAKQMLNETYTNKLADLQSSNLTEEEKVEANTRLDNLKVEALAAIDAATTNQDVATTGQEQANLLASIAFTSTAKSTATNRFENAWNSKKDDVANADLSSEEKATLNQKLDELKETFIEALTVATTNQAVDETITQALETMNGLDIQSHRELLLIDTTTGVQVRAVDRSIFGNKKVQLYVERVQQAIPSYDTTDLNLYEIEIRDEDGNKVNFNGQVTVTLPIDRTVDKVIHVTDTGTVEELPFRVVGDTVLFDTTHFSVYGVVYQKEVVGGNGSANNPIVAPANNNSVSTTTVQISPKLPNTGHTSWTGLACTSLLIAYMLYRKIKQD